MKEQLILKNHIKDVRSEKKLSIGGTGGCFTQYDQLH